MTAQQLKNSILQMAVQGKLVPQNPDDEPASVLLERIKAEKQELIKQGKIKKDKKSSEIFRGTTRNLPYTYCEQVGTEIRDISDEIPFDIPESWEWCRLIDLTIKEIKRGKSPIYADRSSVLVFAQKCNVKTGGINITLAKYLSESAISKYQQEEYIVDCDIIVNSTGTGTLGRIGIYSNADNIDNMPLVPDSHVTIVRVDKEFSQYIYYILKWYQPLLVKMGEGSTKQKELKADRIKELFIPFPPVSEQYRIVAKIEELLPYIEKYEQAEMQLSSLNANFPEALKKSILQEAVQGRLVPQNSDDEPASVLLERIRTEKQALIKAGKIKKDKHESVIVTRDKIPYEIPDSWVWCRLAEICKSITDGDHQPPPQVPNGKPFIVISNISGGTIDFSNTRYVPDEYYNILDDNRKPIIDDILFTVTGSYGIVMKVDTDKEFCFQRHIALLKPLYVDSDFLVYWLRTPLVFEQCKATATGTAQKTVGLTSLKNIIIPLPPLDEQQRIVSKIEEIMSFINTFSK